MPAWSINRSIRTPLLLLGIVEFLLFFSSLFISNYVIHDGAASSMSAPDSLLLPAAISAVVMLLALISTGLYDFHQRIYYHEALVRVLVGCMLGALAITVILSIFSWSQMLRLLGPFALVYVVIILLLLRFLFLRTVDENAFRHRTLVYGAGTRAQAISELRRKADRRGFRVIGHIPAPGDDVITDNNGLTYHDGDIEQLAIELDADEIVIAMDDRRGNFPIRRLLNCKLRGIDVIDLVEFLERETGKIRIDLVNPGWLIFSNGFRISRPRRFFKRAVDLVFSTAIALLGLPLMLGAAIAIKIEDGARASIFYRQRRVGYRGRNFDVLKFRSMREDAEADGKAVWAEQADPRITRVGRVLRKFRLDELPQAINVLRGEMSIVGPRPERPEFVKALTEKIPYYSERHSVNPGVTGWAQIQYPYGSSEHDAAEKLQYDLYYVKNHNLLLDLVIILQTVEVVLWGKGSR